MQVETIRDILHWTGQFHTSLSECLNRGAQRNKSERCVMILEYLAEHEARLAKVLADSEKDGDVQALDTWCYDYMNDRSIVNDALCDAPFHSFDSAEIIHEVMEQHNQVIELYRNLSERADIPEARELLESLHSFEEHEAMQMTQTANRFSDM